MRWLDTDNRAISVQLDLTGTATGTELGNKDKMKVLDDKFLKYTTWIIAVENTDRGDEDAELMDVFRLIVNKPVEAAGYSHQPQAAHVHKLIKKYGPDGFVEVNRLAVSSKYRSCRKFNAYSVQVYC